jgi:hypothetical protein
MSRFSNILATVGAVAMYAAPAWALTDADSDGYHVDDPVDANKDCDDAKADVHPGATDIQGNGVDEDCDGTDAVAAASAVTGGTTAAEREEAVSECRSDCGPTSPAWQRTAAEYDACGEAGGTWSDCTCKSDNEALAWNPGRKKFEAVGLAGERAARVKANVAIDNRVAAEEVTRANADDALRLQAELLGESVDAIAGWVDLERDERKGAEAALGVRIDTERTERTERDTTLTRAIGTEQVTGFEGLVSLVVGAAVQSGRTLTNKDGDVLNQLRGPGYGAFGLDGRIGGRPVPRLGIGVGATGLITFESSSFEEGETSMVSGLEVMPYGYADFRIADRWSLMPMLSPWSFHSTAAIAGSSQVAARRLGTYGLQFNGDFVKLDAHTAGNGFVRFVGAPELVEVSVDGVPDSKTGYFLGLEVGIGGGTRPMR